MAPGIRSIRTFILASLRAATPAVAGLRDDAVMRMMLLITMMVLGAAAACSSSDDVAPSSSSPNGGGATTNPVDGGTASTADAPAKCKELVGLFCARAVECTPSDAGTPEVQKESCITAVGESLNCDAATAVGDTYAVCTTEMPAIDCAKFASNAADVLPQSCRGVMQSPTPPAPPPPQTSSPTIDKPNIILGRASSNGPFDTYLGCLCNETDPDSVISPVGRYGSQSKFSTSSIWNRFGTFGSDYSSQSACNKFALDPPVVVNNGQIVGRLTRNSFASGAITDPAVVSLLNGSVCVN